MTYQELINELSMFDNDDLQLEVMIEDSGTGEIRTMNGVRLVGPNHETLPPYNPIIYC